MTTATTRESYELNKVYNLSDFATRLKYPTEGAKVKILISSTETIEAIFSKFTEKMYVPRTLGYSMGMPDQTTFDSEVLLSVYGTPINPAKEKKPDGYLCSDPSLESIAYSENPDFNKYQFVVLSEPSESSPCARIAQQCLPKSAESKEK